MATSQAAIPMVIVTSKPQEARLSDGPDRGSRDQRQAARKLTKSKRAARRKEKKERKFARL